VRSAVRVGFLSLHGFGVYAMQDWFFSEARRHAAESLRLPDAVIQQAARAAADEPDRSRRFGVLIDGLAAAAAVPREELLQRFGHALFGRITALFPVFFVDVRSTLDFLADFERHVHDEMRRSDPRLDPPRIECARPSPGRVELVYRSPRGLADLAHGLITGCIAHFGDDVAVERSRDAAGAVRFVVSERTNANAAVRSA
jgi:hypothetical protein